MFFGQFLSLKAAKALDFFSKDPILPTAFLNFDALFLQTPFHDLVDQLNRQRFISLGPNISMEETDFKTQNSQTASYLLSYFSCLISHIWHPNCLGERL